MVCLSECTIRAEPEIVHAAIARILPLDVVAAQGCNCIYHHACAAEVNGEVRSEVVDVHLRIGRDNLGKLGQDVHSEMVLRILLINFLGNPLTHILSVRCPAAVEVGGALDAREAMLGAAQGRFAGGRPPVDESQSSLAPLFSTLTMRANGSTRSSAVAMSIFVSNRLLISASISVLFDFRRALMVVVTWSIVIAAVV